MAATKNKQFYAFDVVCPKEIYKKAYRSVQWHAGVLRPWPLVTVAAVVVLLFAISMVYATRDVFFIPSWLLAGLAVVGFFGYFVYADMYILKRQNHYWNAYNAGGREKAISIYRCGLVVSSATSIRIQMPYLDCITLLERREYFVLIENRRSFLIIPKASIPADVYADVRSYLKNGFAKRYEMQEQA